MLKSSGGHCADAFQNIVRQRGLNLSDAFVDEFLRGAIRDLRGCSRDGNSLGNGLRGFLRVLLGTIRLGTLTRAAGGTNDMCDDIIRNAPRMSLNQLQAFVRNNLLTAARGINRTEHLEIGQAPTNTVYINGTLAVRQVG